MFSELPDREHRTRICADGPGAANPLKHHFQILTGSRLVASRCEFGVRVLGIVFGPVPDSLFGAGIG
jgi:hypothetical protein